MHCKFACLLLTGLLCGCSAVKSPETLANSVKEGYAQASSIDVDAAVQTASKDGFMDYKIHVSYKSGENPSSEITITAPEKLKGIKAVFDGQTGSLTYDGMILQTQMTQRSGVSAMDAVPAIISCLCSDTADAVWMEGDSLTLEYVQKNDAGTITRDISLNSENGALEQAKIFWNNTQTISCLFSGFALNK